MSLISNLNEFRSAWDEFAEEYYQVERASKLDYANTICDDLVRRGILPRLPAEILDLGGGTGRFAIPLTQRGYQVQVVDFSAKMLAILNQRTQAQKLVPLKTRQLSWQELVQAQERFSTVWLSMLPNLTALELGQISQLAQDRLYVFRLVKATDNYFTPLLHRLGLPPERTEVDETLMPQYQQVLRTIYPSVSTYYWSFEEKERLTWPEVAAYLATLDQLTSDNAQAAMTAWQEQSGQAANLAIKQTYQFQLLYAQR